MGSKWQVKPETDRYTLTWNGESFWVEIKRLLTAGEARRLSGAGVSGVRVPSDEKQRQAAVSREMSLDWEAMAFARTLTYVVDWSLLDDDENKIPINAKQLESFDPSLLDVIEECITKHVERREQEKKADTRPSVRRPKAS